MNKLFSTFITTARITTALISTALLLTSCGYRLQGSGSTLPKDVVTVAILPVENNTTEADLGIKLAEAYRERFSRYGVVKVIDDPRSADAVLKSSVVSLTSALRNVTGGSNVEFQEDLILIVSGELRRTTGQLLWKNPRMAVSEPFASTGNAVVTSSSSFAQSNIGASSLGGLSSREVSRGQQEETLNDLVIETARKVYLEAVSADF